MFMLKVATAFMLVASPIALSAKDMVSLNLPTQVSSDIFAGSRSRDALVAQVLLDNSRHSPGVIDGVMGGNTTRAITSFQLANGLTVLVNERPGLPIVAASLVVKTGSAANPMIVLYTP